MIPEFEHIFFYLVKPLIKMLVWVFSSIIASPASWFMLAAFYFLFSEVLAYSLSLDINEHSYGNHIEFVLVFIISSLHYLLKIYSIPVNFALHSL